VYTPLNSSVYWNSLDVPMDQIERIEVIRGPGDARWGSHAVNGIINIITTRATAEDGTALSVALDSNAGKTLSARNSGQLGADLGYRVYAKYLEQGDFATTGGVPRLGDRNAVRAGVRIDGSISGTDRFSLIGDLQDGRDTSALGGQRSTPTRYDTNEWSTLARWDKDGEAGAAQQVQLSFDRLAQRFYEQRDTFDFSYQTKLAPVGRQVLTFGMTYKHSADVLSDAIAIEPPTMTQATYGVFVHDAIALGARTSLQVGSQFEHNRFTGWEVQPNLQLLYSPAERQSYWASVSRAVRTPFRTEEGFALDVPIFPGGVVRIQGNPDLRSEKVLAWQAGARRAFSETVFLDVAVFYNEYQNLIIQRAGVRIFEPEPAPGRTIFPAVYENAVSGHTTGLEVALKAQPSTIWSLSASVSLYSQTSWQDPLGFGTVTGVEHQFQVHSGVRVSTTVQWNADLYRVGALTTGDVPGGYYKFDTQLMWRPGRKFDLQLGVTNAFEREHQEAGLNSVDAVTIIPRVAYLRILRRL
jgi:iron complex outermembrane receptor protein